MKPKKRYVIVNNKFELKIPVKEGPEKVNAPYLSLEQLKYVYMKVSNHFHARPHLPSKKSLKSG